MSFMVVTLCAVSVGVATAGIGDRIVAVVNDDVITEGDVAAGTSKLLQQSKDAKQPLPTDDPGELRQAVLQRLIDERLILQEAARRGLTVSFEDTAERLGEIRGQFPTREDYEAMLAEARLTEEQLKAKLREQITVQRAIDYQIRPKVQVSPTEIAAASSHFDVADSPGEEIDARHLLIRITEARPQAEAVRMVEQLRQRLLKGADFEPLAREHSEGPHAQEGGRMGWVRRGELLPELDAALFALEAGQVSDLILTDLGVHLLKAAQRRTISETDATSARRKVEVGLYQAKFARELSAWLDELRDRAYIHLIDE